ncbi:sensor histidine kinase [Microbacterium tumbae]
MVGRSSVWRWQLIFAGTVVTIAVVIAALSPHIYASPLFVAGLVLIVTTTIAVLALPWHRIPSRAVVAVPLLDAVGIGLTLNAPDVRLGFLFVLPVTWIATYYSMTYVFTAIGLIACCVVVFGQSSGVPSDILLRVIVLVLTLSFLGATVRIGTQRSRAARRLLRRQSEQVNRAAARAETHQRRVTQIIDALDMALVAVAEDGTILNMNDAYRRIYGRDRFGARLPSPAVEYDDRQGEPLPPERTALARAASGERLEAERIWLFDTEGRWRALEATTERIASVADAKCTTLLIIDDVTARLEAAQERRTMTAVVSHELRNPLTAILGHVDLLLERDDLPAHVVQQLRIVESAGERMQRLVASVLDEGQPQGDPLSEPVDLRQLVDASVASFLPTAESGDLAVRAEGADTLLIYGDAFRLRQAIDNLLGNAVKYTPPDGTISVTLGGAAGGLAELVISDTGTGMSAADVERVFQPYFRADDAVLSGIPGTGLGMGIVRDIVEAHRGTIEVVSAVGVGTRVTLRFPRRPIRKEAA